MTPSSQDTLVSVILRYRPTYGKGIPPRDDREFRVRLTVPQRTDIADILPQFHASGVLKYDPDRRMVVDPTVLTAGNFERGETYSVISENYRKTMLDFRRHPQRIRNI